jgi:hypothetical protein
MIWYIFLTAIKVLFPGKETIMGQSPLTFQIQAPTAELLSQVQKLAQEFGGQFQGDEQSGRVALPSILGTIESDYTVEGDQLYLTITKKPFLIGYETISSLIREYVPALT